jgi:rod shape-determining protein MreB
MAVHFISRHFVRDLGIDLGTANCIVYERNRGVVLQEPSVVAVQKSTKKILAIGEEARQMIGRTPGDIVAIRPLREGVIADFDVTKELIRFLIRESSRGKVFLKPRTVVSIPSGTTEVERRAVVEAALNAGSREVYLIEEPVAAAIGAGLPVHEPTGNMVIDIGGGTSDIAIISLGGVVTGKSVRTGGDAMDDAITRHIRRTYGLMIGERTAEEIKMTIGSAYPMKEEMSMEIRGRDQVSGLPKVISVDSKEIREALSDAIQIIINAVRYVIERTPPELVADIMGKEIVMTGGGALLRGFDQLFKRELGMKVILANDPLLCVALGTGKTLEHIHLLSRVLVASKKVGGQSRS